LKADNESLVNLAAPANQPASLSDEQFTELLRLRGEAGVFQERTRDLARLQQDNRGLLSRIASFTDPTNQLSADDQYTLRQTHVVDAMTLMLNAIKSYATNHDGQYPESLDQLTAAGDLETNRFAGNLGLDDFELMKDGTVDPRGDKVLLTIREPIPRAGQSSVIVDGEITDAGLTRTEIMNVNP
jgi:hypothetical protein